MNKSRKLLILLATLFLPVLSALAQAPSHAGFSRLVDDYFAAYFHHRPTEASAAGFHQFDTRLEDYSRAGIDAQIRMFRLQLASFSRLDPKTLNMTDAADRELVLSSIRSHLLELERIRSWEKDPGNYVNGINSSVFILAMRESAPLAVRLQYVIAREKQMLPVFRAAHLNLKNPPRIYTQIAIDNMPGIIGFFRDDLTLAFKDVRSRPLQAAFKRSNDAVIRHLIQYEKFLKDDLLPRSNGDYRIGPELFRKKLLYDEMVDIPLDKLLEVGYANLRANQESFRKTAARIDPGKTAAEILAESQKEHPSADKLLDSIRGVLGSLQKFIREHRIITIPSDIQPLVKETPPFMRSTTTASMDTPGPYEKAKEAFYFATLPDPSWPKEKIEDFLGGFTYGTVLSTSIHEAYPGHYTQFLWVQRAPSKVRKLIGCGTNSEGWAHYTEQMMLDQGYGDDDPKMRLGQLQDALLRNARFVVGIEMHTGRMTFDQAVEFFVREGYQSREIAIIESKRGTSDPTYLIYTLGKLAIMKLRDDYQTMKGASFSLMEFHDAFMKQGFVPIRLVRRALLGREGALL